MAKLPRRGDVVIGVVKKITPHSFFADLENYDSTAIVHISEISSSWVKNIKSFVREGQIVVLKVVDVKGNQVIASLKRVSSGERKRKLQERKLNKKIDKLIDVFAKENKIEKKEVESIKNEILTTFGSYSNFYDSIKEFGDEVLDELKTKHKKKLYAFIKDQLKEKEVIVRRLVELTTLAGDGVEKIKSVFKACLGKAKATVVASPKYNIEVTAKSYKEGEKMMQDVIKCLETNAKKEGLEFKVLEE